MHRALATPWPVALSVGLSVSLVAAWAAADEREWPDLIEPGLATGEAEARAGHQSDEADGRSSQASAEGQAEQPDDEQPLALDAGPLRLVPRLQYRLRYRHYEGHDLTSGGVSDTLRHRARVGLRAAWPKWSERLGIVVDLQDVRTFGEETSTLGDYSADGFDLHQGYAWVRLVRGFEIRLGRQEIAYENERILGAVDWSEQGRSFDAVRFSYDDGELGLDSFYAKIRETNIGLGVADPPSAARHALGGNVSYDMMPEFSVGLVALADVTENQGKKQVTVGGIATGTIGSATSLRYSGEGYYQFGSAYGGVSYSAFLAAANARLTFDLPAKPYLEGYGEFLSGDEEPTDLTERTFEVPLATNHKFYGEMDFFLNMPVDTDERGLRDVGGAVGAMPMDGFHLRGAYHLFQAMVDRPDGLETFGHELDVKADYRFWTHARVAMLYALFFPQGLKERGVADPTAEHFVYVTTEVKF